MPLSRRYSPEWAPLEQSTIGMDFSSILPPGTGIASGTLSIQTNTVPPVDANADFTATALSVVGRAIYTTLSGGVNGKDYLLDWSITDTSGNIWPRTAMLLCAPTS